MHQSNKATDGRALTNVRPSYNQDNDLTWHPNALGFDFSRIGIQPKLKVSQHGDMYEQEADRVAEQVIRMPISDSALPLTTAKEEGIDRQCLDCEMEEEEEEEMEISRKPSATSNLEASEEVTNEIKNVRSSSGSPLEPSIKEFMGSRFGYDFGNVKIHAGETASRSADSVDARAYTVGNDIVFGQGQYQPDTLDGRRLLAHELTHVIQQRSRSSELVPSLQRDDKDEKKTARQREVLLGKEMLGASKGARLISDDDNITRAYLGIPKNEPAADVLIRRANGDFDIGDSKGSDPNSFERQAENTYKYLQKKHPRVRVRIWMKVKATADLSNLGSGYSAPNGILVDANNRPIRIAGKAVTVTGGTVYPERGSPPAAGKSKAISAKPLAPLERPMIHDPAKLSSKATLLAAGAQALNSMMFSNIQGAESNKAMARLEQLWPEIEQLRSQGYGVTVTGLAEVPDKFDIAAAWSGVRDASQIVYYKDMFISVVARREEEHKIQPSSIREGPTMRANLAPSSTPGQLFERQKSRPGWHIESRHLTLPAYPIRESGGIDKPTSINQEIAGVYTPVSHLQKPGEAPIERSYFLNRLLKINYINLYEALGSLGTERPNIKNTIEMWDTDESRPYTFHNPYNASFQLITNGLSLVNNGKFTITKQDSRLPHTLNSNMWYLWVNEVSGGIVEEVIGTSPYNDWSTTTWSAKIVWKKI